MDISPNYIREDREGGLDAVGTGFPAIPRQDLMVLTDQNWQAEHTKITYESWASEIEAESRK